MHTDAVDWEALSTPVFNIETKGVNRRLMRVSTYTDDESPSASSTYFPKSIKTLAHACWTVLDVSEKYKCRISIILKTVFTVEGEGLSIGSMSEVLNISAMMENINISCSFVLLGVPYTFNDFKAEK